MARPVVVVGAGAVGLATALALADMGHEVTVLEKEAKAGLHQSGRNSGVIHAGYNLRPGSQKALFCLAGNRRMHDFCKKRGVAVEPNGILVVARTETEEPVLRELERRAGENGVPARAVDATGIQDIEPGAVGMAGLHAPSASSVDAAGYVEALRQAAQEAGAQIRMRVSVTGWTEDRNGVTVQTAAGTVPAGALVNAAGLHADRVARELAGDLGVVPFRGHYARLSPAAVDLVRAHIYSAPQPDFPFLGVHLSRRTDGNVYVGPGAMPALGREAYRFGQVDLRDLRSMVLWPGTWRLLADPRVRGLVGRELARSLWMRAIWKEARRLVPALRPHHLVRGAPAGNRAQLVDREGHLVDDIVVRETPRSVHVLNAVSPGLTCSIPFGEHLAQRAAGKV